MPQFMHLPLVLLCEVAGMAVGPLVVLLWNNDALGQIRDDMLDAIGDAAILGKAVGKDAGAGRKSATALLGILFLYMLSDKETEEEYGRNFRRLWDTMEVFGGSPRVHERLVWGILRNSMRGTTPTAQ